MRDDNGRNSDKYERCHKSYKTSLAEAEAYNVEIHNYHKLVIRLMEIITLSCIVTMNITIRYKHINEVLQ